MTVNIVNLDELGDAYDRLYAGVAPDNVFLTGAWLRLRLAHFDGARGRVLAQRDDRGLAAVLVLVEHDDAWRSLIEHSYLPGILARPDVAQPYRAIMRQLYDQKVRRVELDAYPDEDGFRTGLHAALEGSYLSVARQPGCTRAIAVDQPFEAYLASRPGKVRAELRRKARKLDKDAGPVTLRCLSGAAERDEALGACEQIEAESWKADAHSAIISSPEELAFYRGVYDLDAPDVRGQLYLLHAGAEPLAYALGVRHGSRFYALKTSYRAGQAKLAPGQVLFFHLIEALCADEAIGTIELLGMDSRWKREVASREHRTCTYELHRDDLVGRSLVFAHERLKPAVQRAADEHVAVRKTLDVVMGGLQRARALSLFDDEDNSRNND